MKTIFTTSLLILLLAGCAAKAVPFDPVTRFKEAEQYMQKGEFEDARKAYQEIQEKATDRSFDADIMLRIADTYFGEERYDEAKVEYDAFLNFHPVNKNAAYAQYQVAMCSFRELPTVDRDPEIVRLSVKAFTKLIEKYPRSPYTEQARKYLAVSREHLAQYELYVARFYFKKESYQAAIGRLERLLREHPDSLTEKDALYTVAQAYLESGERQRARQTLETLAKKYPSMAGRAQSLMNKIKNP